MVEVRTVSVEGFVVVSGVILLVSWRVVEEVARQRLTWSNLFMSISGRLDPNFSKT